MTVMSVSVDATDGWVFDGLLQRVGTGPHGVLLADGQAWGAHVARVPAGALFMRRVTLTVALRFEAAAADAWDLRFEVAQPEFGALFTLAPDGTLTRGALCDAASVETRDGGFVVTARFIGRGQSLTVGFRQGDGDYMGEGRALAALSRFDPATAPADDWLDEVPAAEKLVLVDVGAAAGLQPAWLRHAQHVAPVLFEPNPAEARVLRAQIGRMPGGRVIEQGLAHRPGARTLHVAHWFGCTSMRRPNTDVLGQYRIAPLFETVGEVTVDCTRYDLLHAAGAVPAPDVVKLDVEGFEYEVLLGFGGLLETCLGVETEAAHYPVYQGQALLGDIVELLARFGLVLRRTEPVPGFEGDEVIVNAFFTRNRAAVAALEPARRRKFARLCAVWSLPPYPDVTP
ncbi:FkbM family methyltransferase [Acidisphaera rubrifaciens]|uniref:Methyltransferase FkbM n=1 Tax=Acidisphaera rubrifaciens HS-AP3 TaxID=1231350 RepID=A0A0D6P5T3_9PROT|nr:FkbM family methyltransferase [Acidisphaera rubrifaciens]GAN77037.1 methyltransferase FkbM [Acidisphaera rubrifaciens HS-AP3]